MSALLGLPCGVAFKSSPRSRRAVASRPRFLTIVDATVWTLDTPGCQTLREVEGVPSKPNDTSRIEKKSSAKLRDSAVMQHPEVTTPLNLTDLFRAFNSKRLVIGDPESAKAARMTEKDLSVNTKQFTEEKCLVEITTNHIEDGTEIVITSLCPDVHAKLHVNGSSVEPNTPTKLQPGSQVDFSGHKSDLVYELLRDTVGHA